MNCYNHPTDISVALCQDCGKGLCKNCASQYEEPICVQCNKKRINKEKGDIVKEFVITFLVGTLLTLYVLSRPLFSSLGFKDIILVIIMFYIYSSVVSGWKALNAITPNVFLILPIFGWIFFFSIKFILSLFIGPFVFPFRLYKKIKRLKDLNSIPLN